MIDRLDRTPDVPTGPDPWAPPPPDARVDGPLREDRDLARPSRRRPRRPTVRATRLLRYTLAAGAIAASIALNTEILIAVIGLFVIVTPFEKLYPRQRGQRLRRPMAGTDIAFALLSPLLNVVGVIALVIIGGLSFFWLPGLLMRPVVGAIPNVALPIVGFLLFDLVTYWTHRFAHEVPFMWRFHAVHHSPEHMDWISGFRVHPFDGVVIAPAFFFLLGAGFGVELSGVLAVFQLVIGLFFHANVRVRWRLLDRVVANPEFHHWHHSSERDAIAHNYGAALPWWDLAFGTYFMPDHRSGRRPQRYGIDEPLPTDLVGQLTHPCRGWRRHLWLWRHPLTAVRTAGVATRNLLADIARSARRPTHSIRRSDGRGAASTNSSLIGLDAVPLPPKRPLPARPVRRSSDATRSATCTSTPSSITRS